MISIIDRYVHRKSMIVDLGCGAGTLDYYLASRGNYVVGVDISENAIRTARSTAVALRLSERVKFLQKSLTSRSIQGKYAVVLLIEVIEHLSDEDMVLRLANRLLKKGGFLIISTRSVNAPLNKLNFTKSHDRNVGHLRKYTTGELEKIVIAAGFKVMEKGTREGFLRDFMFSFPKFGNQIVRLANKFELVSDVLTSIDNILLEIFGESQIYLVAKK